MSRSRRKTPVFTFCRARSGSIAWFAHVFRRRERMAMRMRLHRAMVCPELDDSDPEFCSPMPYIETPDLEPMKFYLNPYFLPGDGYYYYLDPTPKQMRK